MTVRNRRPSSHISWSATSSASVGGGESDEPTPAGQATRERRTEAEAAMPPGPVAAVVLVRPLAGTPDCGGDRVGVEPLVSEHVPAVRLVRGPGRAVEIPALDEVGTDPP